jgi:TPR repeat protein
MAVVEPLWGDRLAEVWASPGFAGAGVAVGEAGVLTARHVVADALNAEQGRLLCRVVRPGSATAPWVPMRVEWEGAEWDLALLAVDPQSEGAGDWLAPSSPPVVAVALGTSAEPGCEAVGFPESAVQQTGEPGARVRQSEQVVGTVLPAGQGKPPANPERELPCSWVPLDVDTATPGTQAGWGGMSGAGVILPDGRLVGLVVTAESEHQERRLYLVPLAPVLEEAEGFADRLGEITGRRERPETREAARYRRVLQAKCLGNDGQPQAIGDVQDTSVFGVKPADLPGESTYLDYVPRDDDDALRDALREAIESRRMLLVVGPSAAGKSRSASRVACELLPRHRLMLPRAGKLADVVDVHGLRLAPTVVWLDDVDVYAHASLRDTLESLLDAKAVVIGTVRRAELERLAPAGDLRNPSGEALTDPRLVRRIDWRLAWSEEERARLADRATFGALLDAAARGIPVGAYCVAGPKLVHRLADARADEEHPFRHALVRTVLDWSRTGIGQPIPLDEATRLMPAVADVDTDPVPEEVEDALNWARTAVLGDAQRTRQALITLDTPTRSLRAHDYVVDDDERNNPAIPADPVWASALYYATEDGRWAIGVAAFQAGRTDIAFAATRAAAEAGHAGAMNNLGLFLRESDPAAARGWYRRAADAGYAGAMHNLAVLLRESDPAAARDWWERAADAGDADAAYSRGQLLAKSDPGAARDWYERAADAGHADAAVHLGLLLAESDPAAARDWYERAADAGQADAMNNLGLLLAESDPAAARDWYERAIDAGCADAMHNLALLLRESDPAAAQSWWERAAEAGDTDAAYNLGVLLAKSDIAAAWSWWERAAAAGHPSAMYNLGLLLAESDPAAARGWWERAADAGHVEARVKLKRS